MTTISKIIDKDNDSDFPDEVRNLMGLTSEDLTDAVIKSDILLGMAEREIMKEYVPNWTSILNGEDAIAIDALRSCVILKICLNILDSPTVQNYYIQDFRFVDIIMNSGVDGEKLRNRLQGLFLKQLSYCGVEHTGDWPEFKLVGKSDTFTPFQYYIDQNGDLQEN